MVKYQRLYYLERNKSISNRYGKNIDNYGAGI